MNKEVKQLVARFQSPQWGDNSKEKQNTITIRVKSFQSPQWEIILKENYLQKNKLPHHVSVPAMGDNSKGYPLESA